MGFMVAAFAGEPPDTGWEHRKRWYAILYKFDEEGRHIGTDHWFAGTTADGEDGVLDKARNQLQVFISALPDISFEDVSVRLFETIIDGNVFGLRQMDDPDELVELVPNDFIFYSPWNGNYDT